MNGDNIILDRDDNAYGFYEDLYKFYTKQIETELKGRAIENAKTLIEELEELSDLCDYDGIIKISDNNGMGFSATPFTKKGE